jgi:GPH family glycoside/pentoside/hexuronide:cation symporter
MGGNKLPFSRQLTYAAGMMGWSMLTNTIIVMLPFYYLPPSNAGLTPLVPQLLLLGVLNITSVIFASGRLVDAVYDPFIASLSDKSTNPSGRRIPFMKKALIPAAVFCFLTFHPLVRGGKHAQCLVAHFYDDLIFCIGDHLYHPL